MMALIDGDIIPYEFGGMTLLEDPNVPLPEPVVKKLVDERLESIIKAVEADSFKIYLTDSDSNFRKETATILPYKGTRPLEKQPNWGCIRQHLIDNWEAVVCRGIEADDRLGIEQGKAEEGTTVICSRDKDLNMIPGNHYIWPCGKQKEQLFTVSDIEGIRFFYKQLLTGDPVDNIPGLYRVGAKSSCVMAIDGMDTEEEMFWSVMEEYKARFGNYAEDFLFENAKLLWILREEPDANPEVEIENRLFDIITSSWVDEE